MALSLLLTHIKLRNAQDIECAELVLSNSRHFKIIQQGRGTFYRDFDEPLMFTTEQLSLLVGRKNLRFGLSSQTITESIPINSTEILSELQRQRAQKKSAEVTITRGVLSVTLGVLFQTKPAAGEEVLRDNPGVERIHGVPPGSSDSLLLATCPRFRILVVGKTGVGKSTLINRIFGSELAHVAKDGSGQAAIAEELVLQENDSSILHIRRDHGPAEGSNSNVVMSFIEERRKKPDIKDQLHAIWLCCRVPIIKYGEQLLQDGVAAFLKEGRETFGNTPTIVVFTKYDRLIHYVRKKKSRDPEAAAKRYLQTYCIEPIQDFTGGPNILHVAVSSKPECERGLEELVNVTREIVYKRFTSSGITVPSLYSAAAGVPGALPTLKIELSVEVGKQRYWRALVASANFRGYTMQDCLGVVHTDIVLIWNFYDPSEYLNSEDFRHLMLNMVENVVTPAESFPLPHSDPLSGSRSCSLLVVPIILPTSTWSTIPKWPRKPFQRLQAVHKTFMAYIVHLTHVLEVLFLLTAGVRAKKLTRTAIKLAYKAYYESSWMRNVHMDVRLFEGRIVSRDSILEKIASLISVDADANAREVLGALPSFDPERDEEWSDHCRE
ncbi:hypothetical protein BKA82DRAFT_994162 [Pisolithus tinctorius]|uniref:G domain-containing protein n=1 Tax=Pisolithus tinctorius Marx 270 TaxID=870435 RepID=A0A0C3PEF8_PISTI|nr:hypothetical protein BKA82DRAFT_994162 [Pisolithus tinctorius]KIO12205.1 hypothetical protein M404DRAFT_994162 [Pisolithus tinctorius Marx 270]